MTLEVLMSILHNLGLFYDSRYMINENCNKTKTVNTKSE